MKEYHGGESDYEEGSGESFNVAKIPTWEEKAVVATAVELEALLAIMLQQEAVTARSLSGIGRMRNN